MANLKVGSWAILIGMVLVACAVGARANDASMPGTAASAEYWETRDGEMAFVPDRAVLESLGLSVVTLTQTATIDELPDLESVFAVTQDSSASFVVVGGTFRSFLGGGFQTTGELFFGSATGVGVSIGDLFVVRADPAEGASWLVFDVRDSGDEVFRVVSHGMVNFDRDGGAIRWHGLELAMTESFADRLGVNIPEGTVIARLFIETAIEPTAGGADLDLSAEPLPAPGFDGQVPLGPDVFVGDLAGDITRWGREGTITAYSISTTSCNAGDEPLLWISESNQHPVIGQNLYRLKDGRFEQIGMSWLKHGFFALSETYCYPDCIPTDGSALGVHCSDPYSSSLNGSTSRLGPRSDVNASTGVYPWPFTSPPIPPTIGRRLQVHNADIDPALNAGALYYAEAMYVTADDAAANNKGNNVSHRRVFFSGTNPTFNMSSNPSYPTAQMQSAIDAWKANDPQVVIRRAGPGGPTVDGTFNIGFRVTDNGNGTWTYEYAIHNQDSHRSAGSFHVPVGTGVTLTNIGFHDVDYHSGEPYSLDDWTPTVDASGITWATIPFAVDPNANALRWGTLYNFRFVADAAPVTVNAHLGLFRPKVDPNDPDELTFGVLAPGVDCNGNGIEDSQEDVTLRLTATSSTTVPIGEKLFYDIEAINNSGTPQTGDFWLWVITPSGDPYEGNPIKLKTGKTLQPGAMVERTGVKLRVQEGTPVGDYQLYISFGTYPTEAYCARLDYTVVP